MFVPDPATIRLAPTMLPALTMPNRSRLTRRPLAAIPFVLAMFFGLAGMGCGEQKKVKECSAFVATVNDGVDRVTKTINTVPDSGTAVSELRSLADEMDVLSEETKKVQISLPDLKKFAERYQAMNADIATSARELATAVDAVDRENMTKAQATLDQAVKREGPLIEELNKFCQTP